MTPERRDRRILSLSMLVAAWGVVSVARAWWIAEASPARWRDAVLLSEEERIGKALGRFSPVCDAVRRAAVRGARVASLVPPDEEVIRAHFHVQHLVPEMAFMLVVTGVPPGAADQQPTDYAVVAPHVRPGDFVLKWTGAAFPPSSGFSVVAEDPLFVLLRRG